MGFEITVRPGHSYEITVPASDGADPGTRWVGGRMVQRGSTPVSSATTDAGPLELMYRRRLIVKLDDLQDFSLDHFQGVVRAIGENGGKADLGINPGRCEQAVFAWVRTLDPSRFEVWNHSWDHGEEGPRHRALPLETQIENLDLVQRKVKEELGVTPRAWGSPGIRWKDGWIGDQDDVTYLAVRCHPELVAIFDGGRTAKRLGLQHDPDPLFDPINLVTFESPPEELGSGRSESAVPSGLRCGAVSGRRPDAPTHLRQRGGAEVAHRPPRDRYGGRRRAGRRLRAVPSLVLEPGQ